MIYTAETKLKDHPKKFNSVHMFNSLKWLMGRDCAC